MNELNTPELITLNNQINEELQLQEIMLQPRKQVKKKQEKVLLTVPEAVILEHLAQMNTLESEVKWENEKIWPIFLYTLASSRKHDQKYQSCSAANRAFVDV